MLWRRQSIQKGNSLRARNELFFLTTRRPRLAWKQRSPIPKSVLLLWHCCVHKTMALMRSGLPNCQCKEGLGLQRPAKYIFFTCMYIPPFLPLDFYSSLNQGGLQLQMNSHPGAESWQGGACRTEPQWEPNCWLQSAQILLLLLPVHQPFLSKQTATTARKKWVDCRCLAHGMPKPHPQHCPCD